MQESFNNIQFSSHGLELCKNGIITCIDYISWDRSRKQKSTLWFPWRDCTEGATRCGQNWGHQQRVLGLPGTRSSGEPLPPRSDGARKQDVGRAGPTGWGVVAVEVITATSRSTGRNTPSALWCRPGISRWKNPAGTPLPKKYPCYNPQVEPFGTQGRAKDTWWSG